MQNNTSEGGAEGAIGAPLIKPEHKPKRSPRKPAAAKPAKAAASDASLGKTYEITLHDNKEIPPNGQFIGVNGKQYLLRPGIRTKVPAAVLEVLDNAVQALPEVNEKLQVTGMRNAPRLNYTLHRD